MTRLLPFLFLPLLALGALAQTPTVRLGTWNLEFLGAEGNYRQDLPPRDAGDYAAIGRQLRALGVVVLAVQEINDAASLGKVAAAAGPTWQVLLGTSGGWDDGKTAQRIGFLYDGGAVELLHAEELLQLPREQDGVPIFHRVPVTACFRHRATGFDFRAVTVHLKAGQKAPDEQKRKLEATALRGWFEALLQAPGEDQDVVLLGDFNATYGTDPERVLEAGGLLRYVDQPQPQPTIQHFPEPIDQIVLGRGFAEAQPTSYRVHADFGGLDKAAWRKTYSDHFPVLLDCAAAGDDDPQAVFARGPAAQVLPVERRPAGAKTADELAPKREPREPREPRAPRAAAPTSAATWPPAVGSEVVVTVGGGPGTQLTGTLLQALPTGPGGWVVIERQGKAEGYPLHAVLSVRAR